MRRIFMKCFIFKMFILSSVLSIWCILVYEFEYECITITSYTAIKGWPETAKALSYGVIGGWMIYGLTVFLPHEAEKRKRQISIRSKLVSLNEELSYFIESANIQDDNIEKVEYSGDSNITLISAASFSFILCHIPWDSIFPKENHSYTEQALIILRKIYVTIPKIRLENGVFLTENQLKSFATIDTVFLRQNWIEMNPEIGHQKIDVIKGMLEEIAYALQKSINIPTNLNQKV